MRIVDNETIKQWQDLLVQLKNDYHMSESDRHELVRLNHLIMETCHDIHNKNMMEWMK